DDDVDGQFAAVGQMRLERLDVQVELTLVVDGPAREELTVANGRLERRRLPQIERLCRLHVVVTVDQHCLRAGSAAPLADDDGVSGRRVDLRLEADLRQLRG